MALPLRGGAVLVRPGETFNKRTRASAPWDPIGHTLHRTPMFQHHIPPSITFIRSALLPRKPRYF